VLAFVCLCSAFLHYYGLSHNIEHVYNVYLIHCYSLKRKQILLLPRFHLLAITRMYSDTVIGDNVYKRCCDNNSK
jgi:hypothetical protein